MTRSDMERPLEWVCLGKFTLPLPPGITVGWKPRDANGDRPTEAMRCVNEDEIKRVRHLLSNAERDALDAVVANGRYWLHTNPTLLIDFLEDERPERALPKKRGRPVITPEEKAAAYRLWEEVGDDYLNEEAFVTTRLNFSYGAWRKIKAEFSG